MFQKNDKVIVKLGKGKVVNVDTTTYSIIIYAVELTSGR